MILYQIVVRMSKKLFFYNGVHFIDEENMVTYAVFDCGITFFLNVLQKSDRSTENGNTFPDPVKNPNEFPATFNIPVRLMSSIGLISF